MVNQICFTIVWVVITFSWWTSCFAIKYYPGSFSANALAAVLTATTAPLVPPILLSFMTPKQLFVRAFTLVGVIYIAMALRFGPDADNEESKVGVLGCICCFNLLQGIIFTTVYSTHPTMFPTMFAATSMGISNFGAGVAVIFAPFLAEFDYPVPNYYSAALCIFAALSSTFIIEAKSRVESTKKEQI